MHSRSAMNSLKACIMRRLLLYSILNQPATVKTATAVLDLYNNGTPVDTTMFPKCIVGDRIDLLSSNYISRDCSDKTTCFLPLTAKAQLLLHQMCSLQESCSKFTFPVSDIREKNVTGIRIKYRCLDQFSSFMDVCSNTTKTTNTNVNLLLGNRFNGNIRCQCTIGDGRFSILLNDIRLISTTKGRCSEIELQLDSRIYQCNDTQEDHGSVFNYNAKDETSGVTITLNGSFPTASPPQMIWITIAPTESTSIKCESHNVILYASTTPGSRNHPSDNIVKSKTLFAVVIPVIAGSLPLVLLVILVVYLWKRRKSREELSKDPTKEMNTTQPQGKKPCRQQTTGGTPAEEVPLMPKIEDLDREAKKFPNQETHRFTQPRVDSEYTPEQNKTLPEPDLTVHFL